MSKLTDQWGPIIREAAGSLGPFKKVVEQRINAGEIMDWDQGYDLARMFPGFNGRPTKVKILSASYDIESDGEAEVLLDMQFKIRSNEATSQIDKIVVENDKLTLHGVGLSFSDLNKAMY